MNRNFSSFACIDWSGQNVAHPKGLALAVASGDNAPQLMRPTQHKYWSRAELRDWMLKQAAQSNDILIGLDLSFALPFADKGAYFPQWNVSPSDPKSLWALVDKICADDPFLSAFSMLSHPEAARHFRHSKEYVGDLFGDDPKAHNKGLGRLRRVEKHQRITPHAPSRAQSASCFNLVGAAQVGKSSLTGMRVLHQLSGAIPIWPFDPIPKHGPMIVEIYTSIAARAAGVPKGYSKIRDKAHLDAALINLHSPISEILTNYDDHSTDAIITAAWMRLAASNHQFWSPNAMKSEIAAQEGWTFGVI